MQQTHDRIRYAVVGLGSIAQEAVLPAFRNAPNSELAALVSGNPVKHEALGRRYGVRCYPYDDFEKCLSDERIQAVYVCLPNHLHCEYTERAAEAGVHVLCEKPMAPSEDHCRRMIESAARHQVKLMIAYRLHFEEGNLEAIRIVNSGEIGEARIFQSVFCQQVVPGNVRVAYPIDQGGGPLFDMGVYCINAARYLFRDEPVEVTAFRGHNGEARFENVEEMTSVMLRFPRDRVAVFTVSFGAASISVYTVAGTKGVLRADPAYDYDAAIKHHLTIGSDTRERVFTRRDQFGPELIYFSDCIRHNRQPEPSGEEGLADVQIVEATYRALETRRSIRVEAERRTVRPDPSQQIRVPPAGESELVEAETPSGGR